jgi:hypothetical protein
MACTVGIREERKDVCRVEKLKTRDRLEAKASQSNLAATFRKNLLLFSSRFSSGLLNPGNVTCGKLRP